VGKPREVFNFMRGWAERLWLL